MSKMSVLTKVIIGAMIIVFAGLHAGGVAMMMNASDRSTVDSAVVLRGD